MGPLVHFVYAVLDGILGLLVIAIIISAILSWLVAFDVINLRNPLVYNIARFLDAVTRPILRPVQKVIPPIGGVDISPIIVLIVIQAFRSYLLRSTSMLLLALKDISEPAFWNLSFGGRLCLRSFGLPPPTDHGPARRHPGIPPTSAGPAPPSKAQTRLAPGVPVRMAPCPPTRHPRRPCPADRRRAAPGGVHRRGHLHRIRHPRLPQPRRRLEPDEADLLPGLRRRSGQAPRGLGARLLRPRRLGRARAQRRPRRGRAPGRPGQGDRA